MGNCCLMDTEFQFCIMKRSAELLHNCVNTLSTAELDKAFF